MKGQGEVFVEDAASFLVKTPGSKGHGENLSLDTVEGLEKSLVTVQLQLEW